MATPKERIARAKQEIAEATAAHRQEFRLKFAELCAEYELTIESRFTGGCEIVECSSDFSVDEVPE